MKKISFSILILILLFTLVGCGHKHEYTDEVVSPTCTEKGYTKHTCECGDTYNDSEVDALGHKFGEWSVVKEATEEEKGSKERSCSVCGEKETEEIPTLEHVHNYTEKVVAPTCTENGYTEYTCKCGDTYKDNEVVAKHTEEVVAGKDATCTQDGLTEGKKCSVCNEVLVEQTVVSAKGHSFGEWVTVTEPTFTQVGLKEKKCANCEEKETEEIPVLVDPNAGKPVDKVTIGSTKYASLNEALNAAKDGDIIYLPAGSFSEAVKITKQVSIKGNNVGVNPNTDTRKSESLFTGVITVATSNVTIDGIALTKTGQINSDTAAAIKNVTLQNIYSYGIDSDCTWTDASRDYNQNFVMNFVTNTYGNIANIKFINNKFNVKEGGIKLGRVDDITVSGNEFLNFEVAGIRVEGGYNSGTFNFDNNKFVNDTLKGHIGIYFNSYGGSGTSINVKITNNTFKNIGKSTATYVGAIGAKSYQENGATWLVEGNTFENCYNCMQIRNNATSTNHDKYPWTFKATNNTFIGVPEGVYYKCRVNASDSASTNPTVAVFENNTFKDNNGNVITPDENKLLQVVEKVNEEEGYLIGKFDGNSWVVKGGEIQLSTTYVNSSLNELKWKSENPEIATVSSAGTVKGVAEGVAKIVVYDSSNENIKFEFYVTVFNEDPSGLLQLLVNSNNSTVFTKNDLIIGIATESGYYYADIVGSVSKVLFEEYEIHKDHYLADPKNKSTLNGDGKNGVDFITVHYAADMPYSASASLTGGKNLASYNQSCNSSGIQASWHYSVGNDGVWACQNEAYGAWHAGSSKKMTWTKTNVKQNPGDPEIAKVTLGDDGFFYINGENSGIKNTTEGTKLNGLGLACEARDGYYYLGGHYYNTSYKYISSTGGNNNSIGMETSVREGSDLWLTWQYTAQLCADLLLKYELPISRLTGHHFFSGKWCPQPMLENDLEIWWEFVELVKTEMTLFSEYKDAKLSFNSDSKYLDDNGRITSQPVYSQCVTYTVDYTINGETKSITLSSIVPGTER